MLFNLKSRLGIAQSAMFVALLSFAVGSFGQLAKPANPLKKVGKYAVELRIPAEGIYAEEPIDIEFRLTDTSNNDPVQGAAGVIRAVSLAKITMPAMPGMPAQTPRIHSEGIPGDYGIECYFAHGGAYLIDLRITVPGEERPFSVSFNVDVKDAESAKNRKPRAKPYGLQVTPKEQPEAGKPTILDIAIRETATKKLVSEFEVVHEKLLHLIVVSKDLTWFSHEHPEMQHDGSFSLNLTFPAGGDYRLFADVAPKGAGSNILPTMLKVKGVAPTWNSALNVTGDTVETSGIRGTLRKPAKGLSAGTSADLVIDLKDAANGNAITDLQPYLGAMGHLILIHQDGQTFVHSHPLEDDASAAKAKQGTVTFAARFPKAGRYKAWAQFQRGGQVATLAWVFDVVGGK
jgi:hypothetical protein